MRKKEREKKMKPLEIFLQCLICIFLVANIQGQELDELDVLYEYLEELGTDAKVGFLSASNYISVKRKLPANARPVYVAHKEDLTEMVLNGSIVAALTSGLPAQEYHDRLHIFSSTIVTLHSILMAPDESGDFPHGVNEEFSTLDLASAINAAIARVQLKEIDLQIAKKNAPKEIVLAHTCKEDDQTQFQVPNRNSAKGVLRKILDQKVIKVLADGPYNWGDNDGNYLVDPPVGFYPDILDAIIDEFRNLAGPDGEIYGADIRMERISTLASPFPWYSISYMNSIDYF
jgi:hypothetical protein